MPESGAGVIDTDVLWSCVTCGACVEQCPVDIEHVDHIVDMRRYQVLVESNFPAELNQLFKGMENKGNPWNMSPTARMDWAQGLDFEVKVVGAPDEGVESLDEVEWLFWVGCAGAYEDRQKKTTRAVAELLHMADVSFAVLGNGETCNGDQARRAGNEFVFQGLAQQNVETFKEYKVKKVVSTCAHCFNTLKNEYQDFGIELEVVHHTQLLNRLVREGKLTPVKDGAGAHKRKITYHDPCYIGRHNGVYAPPRELLQVLPGADFVEMPRNSERSFCCGAGGARMWMEENLGERINVARTTEAVATGADQIAVGCPFCRVMLSDGLTAAIDQGEAREEVEVLDVAQMLLASVKGEMATKRAPGSPQEAAASSSGGTATALKERPVETKAEPEEGDETITEDTVTETSEAHPPRRRPAAGRRCSTLPPTTQTTVPRTGPATGRGRGRWTKRREAKAASSGGSLFDLGGDDEAAEPEAEAEPSRTRSRPSPPASVGWLALRHRGRGRAGTRRRDRAGAGAGAGGRAGGQGRTGLGHDLHRFALRHRRPGPRHGNRARARGRGRARGRAGGTRAGAVRRRGAEPGGDVLGGQRQRPSRSPSPRTKRTRSPRSSPRRSRSPRAPVRPTPRRPTSTSTSRARSSTCDRTSRSRPSFRHLAPNK